MFSWLFKHQDVKIPPVNDKTATERDILGLKLQRESVLARSVSTQIQETLAHGVVLELRR